MKRGHRIAKLYYNEAFHNIRNKAGVQYQIHAFESFFAMLEIELSSVCEFLDLKMPKDKKKLHDFVDLKLWHHRGIR